MQPNDPNLPRLRAVAEALGDLCERLVFVGGATAGLLLTDPAAESVRATVDVDAILQSSLAQYYAVEEQVAARGFVRNAESGVICRWVHKASGVLFDLMPTDTTVLGFSNRWYADAMATAIPMDLGNGLFIRMICAPAFVATKLEAFAGRGAGDLLASHDIEDLLNVVDGRPELADEVAAAPARLRKGVRDGIAALLAHRDFENGLPGMLSDPDRAVAVMERLRLLAGR